MKIIRIEKCAECFHKSSQLGTAAPYCKLHPMMLAIADTGTVPEWCPLEDDAAPDLLAACEYGHDEHALERLAKRLEGMDGFSGFVVWLRRKAELGRAAIAKAQGKSPESRDLGD